MTDIVEAIIDLFEQDGGYRFTPEEIAYSERLYDALSQEDKGFLCGLSREDLANVCIGEVRDADDGMTSTWLVNGVWQMLPPGVDKFLTDVFEQIEGGA